MSESDGTFGRVLWRPRMGRKWILGAFGAIPVGLVLIVSPLSEHAVRTLVGPGLITFGCFCLCRGWLLAQRAIQVCETGIIDGDTRLAYTDITELAVEMVLITIEGVKSGLEYQVTISGNSSLGRKTVGFTWGNLGWNTTRIEDLIDRISPVIERRMIEFLAGGKAVAWGHDASIRVDGVQFHHRDFIPYSCIQLFELRDGQLIIETAEQRFQIASSETNFFPGHRLAAGILNASRDLNGAMATFRAPIV